MKNRIRIFVMLLAFVLIFTGCNGGTTEASPSDAALPDDAAAPTTADTPADNGTIYNLRFGSFPGDMMEFIQNLATSAGEASNGRLNIEVFNFLTLGSPQDAVAMTKDGSLDAVLMSGSNYVGYEPSTAIAAIPFFCNTPSDALAVANALNDADLCTEWDGHILAFMPTGMQYMAFGNLRLSSLKDFKGIVSRCQNANGIYMIQSFGGTVATVNTNEVYMSLETGIINMSVSSPDNMVSSAYPEVCDYLLDLPLYCDVNAFIMNNTSWAQLPADLQQVLTDCAKEMEQSHIDWLEESAVEHLATLESGGMELIDCPLDVLEAMHETTGPCMEAFMADLEEMGRDSKAVYDVASSTLGKE